MREKLRVFVTGAGGFIGRRLCQTLCEGGHGVVALVRDRGADSLSTLPVEIIRGDLSVPSTYADALKSCTHVVHLAGDPKYGNGVHYDQINLKFTQELIDTIKEHAPDIDRFIFASTVGAIDRVSGDPCLRPIDIDSVPAPKTDYGRSKLAAETVLRESGLPFSIVRPSQVVGPEMRIDSHVSAFVRAALRGKVVARLNWPGVLMIVHVEDLCDAIELLMLHPDAEGKTYFAAGEAISIGRIFEQAAPERRRLSVAPFIRPIKSLVGWFPFVLKSLLVPALAVDDSPLRDLGWEPKRSAIGGLDEVVRRERSRVDLLAPVDGWTLVTGAASGLGKAFAEILSEFGRKLVLVDKNDQGLRGILATNESVLRVPCDLSEPDALQKIQSRLNEENIFLSEVFSCAGFGCRGAVDRLDPARQGDVMTVNATSRVETVATFLPGMVSRRFGRIMLISSSAAFQPLPYMAVYAASNSAVLSFGEAVAEEVRGCGVQVLTVCPGGMQTNFQKSAGVRELAHEKLLSPEAVARQALAALASDKAVVMPTLRSKGMAFFARIMPRRLNAILWKRLMAKMR